MAALETKLRNLFGMKPTISTCTQRKHIFSGNEYETNASVSTSGSARDSAINSTSHNPRTAHDEAARNGLWLAKKLIT
jgi:hypothetical protein